MNTLSGNVHLVAGNAALIPEILAVLKKEGVKIEANPDLYLREHGSFGIDDAHELIARASARALDERRVFLLVANSMTNEAQNALLKTLEEPAGDTLFFFIVPSPDMLLATFRSRAQTLNVATPHMGRPMSHIAAEDFLRATPAQRLDLLKPLLEKGDDDKRDLGVILSFLSALETSLAADARKGGSRDGIEAVYRARKFIGDRGALVKPLLEQMALLMSRS